MNIVKDKGGFSLVEVLIAIFVLSIAIMGLATLQARGIRSNDMANRTTQAVTIAQFKLEEYLHRTSSSPGCGEIFAAGTTQDDENPIDGVFSRSWTFTNNSPASNAQTLEVRVTWSDIMGDHEAIARGIIYSQSY